MPAGGCEPRSATTDPRRIAEVCHEANRALCEAFGDHTQPAWADAPAWQRVSAIAGVQFCIANPSAPPSANHDSWLEEKRATGWRYGPAKDAKAKTHPCFVPYARLPPGQKAKDHVFKAIVAAMSRKH
ncbi:RyR domain-containing protein [Rhodopseudomonas pseudopalustris]|uniref:RyR domain-containing protein n=1 Tax=Rhodopseudomonas pseudopalustris TaxID=1513892 RepID=UPI001AECF86F|nr:RyR domain-containing protein [Rhodopseudomonas pseudopalustris]